ncbi:MAG TPA: hypothetical protein VKB76_15050, partial [Ktedonobacterales bacterium]|nr:hypothetical protein [Ktedonobacterales bacterium]
MMQPEPRLTREQRVRLQFDKGLARVESHRLYGSLLHYTRLRSDADHDYCPENGRALVRFDGTIFWNAKRILPAAEWAFVITHAMLHLAFEHFNVERRDDPLWQVACCGHIN